MADEQLNEEPIIIKKIIKKGGHGGAHGGAWKVAYADFVTAMMCLFLLLWLINVDPSSKAAISQVFKQPSSSGPMDGNIFVFGGAQKPGEAGKMDGGASFLDFQKLQLTEENKKEIQKTLQKELMKELEIDSDKDLLEKIELNIVEEGILIELKDTEGQDFFNPSSAALTPYAKNIIDKLGKLLRTKLCSLIIAGFTDATQFNYGNYDNWNLSTDRAIAVKSRLSFTGLDKSRFARIEGYADTQMKDPTVPLSAANRRITLLLLQDGQKDELLPKYLNKDDRFGRELKEERKQESKLKMKSHFNHHKQDSTKGKRTAPLSLEEIRRKKARQTFRTRHPAGTGSDFVKHDGDEAAAPSSDHGGGH